MIDIINVVEIINGEFNGIENWSSDNSSKAEDHFKKLILSQNGREEDLDTYIEEGCYESRVSDYKVYLSWSNLN